ncbi:membrane dipeptidase [Candidatus Amoebophilus asiaticus]|nr:membrane dipeptidase [Candidatus Amoebophilus asiaticus]
MPTSQLFDLHCHPSLKPMFSLPGNRSSCWHTIEITADNVLENIIDSQSNLQQLLDGGVNLACIALHPVEMAVAKRQLLQIASLFVNYLDPEQLLNIAEAHTTYQQLLHEELTNLLSEEENPAHNQQKIKIIKSISEYDSEDKNTLHLILAVEGGHAFYYEKNSDWDIHKIMNNIEAYKQPDKPRLLYITLTHLAPNALANHAYGNKIFSKSAFIPKGYGLTSLGKSFIRKCYDDTNNRRILIDIKHMSLRARQHFYGFRKTNVYDDIPIIASHVAVTGLSWDQKFPIEKYRSPIRKRFTKIKYKKVPGIIPGTFFNPISINLYEEDIIQILQSKGLIGIILDERILGAGKQLIDGALKTTEKEFIYNREKNLFIKPEFNYKSESWFRSLFTVFDSEDKEDEWHELNDGSARSQTAHRAEMHRKYFINNLLYIIKVGSSIPDVDPWKHICIGSDFDGLINPVDFCKTSQDFGKIDVCLKTHLLEYANLIGVDIDDIDKISHQIMFQNAFDFLEANFS